MGQIHSEEYQLDEEDVADSELNSPTTATSEPPSVHPSSFFSRDSTKKCPPSQPTREQQQQHFRKLSNVSVHRNIQLLSMKPKSEKDTYADGLRARRRSSLINLILGAPSSGPRFCDDLCSINSQHIGELNFGIEFFPDAGTLQELSTAASISSLRFGDSCMAATRQLPLQLEHGAVEKGQLGKKNSSAAQLPASQGVIQAGRRRRSSLESLSSLQQQQQAISGGRKEANSVTAPGDKPQQAATRKPSLSSMLASIDLSSSFDNHPIDSKPRQFNQQAKQHYYPYHPPPLGRAKQTIFESVSQESIVSGSGPQHLGGLDEARARSAAKSRINQSGRVLRRTGSELSLYSTVSGASSVPSQRSGGSRGSLTVAADRASAQTETRLIIMLQVCLPFILAGFGNMAAGLVLNKVAQWRSFQKVPIFFVLLPSFVGLKGNIEMTLASRLSTLSNLNLLDTAYQRRRAYLSNLVLILSQAIGLSLFAAMIAIVCELFIGGTSGGVHGSAAPLNGTSSAKPMFANYHDLLELSLLVVLASALMTAIILVFISSVMISLAIGLAHLIRVNPDNLSTLIAALYGDVSCVYIYGLVADMMFNLREQRVLIYPIVIICCTIILWPILLFVAYKLKETRSIALTSIPPMLASIMISMGSGSVLSIVVGRFKLIALYQPVVNGFGANLIAVQASRVSTWLWCSALRKMSISAKESKTLAGDAVQASSKKLVGSLASFTEPTIKKQIKLNSPEPVEQQPKKLFRLSKMCKLVANLFKILLWSFCNSSPNSIAAKLLLIMLIPAHSLYFLVIWLVSPVGYIAITASFYLIYICLCLVQVFILLTICEPLMTLLMARHLDPDIFGISILMALADLIGTLCLTGAFFMLAALGDANARLR